MYMEKMAASMQISPSGHKRCCVGGCNNDQRYPEKIDIKEHVDHLTWHRVSQIETRKLGWIKMIGKGREDFAPGNETFVCSNHFVDGKPTTLNPLPTLFLTLREKDSSVKKRKLPAERKQLVPGHTELSPACNENVREHWESGKHLFVALQFAHLTREADVRFYTGLPSINHFKIVFDQVQCKAIRMTYWRGPKRLFANPPHQGERRSPEKSLTTEQELLLVLMKLRLGLMNTDLAFRFNVQLATVSAIILTWVKLLARELSCLIIWPSRGQINSTLPDCFRRNYGKVRTIIDCTEVFIETPSSLSAQNKVWSEYKSHCTMKFLVAITPTGAISWISPIYGGRASDVFIVRDSGFLNLLEPFDQVMADRGFKIKTDLARQQCTLAIPPSASKGTQMTKENVRITSRVANVRIHVERLIKRLKEFHILSHYKLPLQLGPVYKDIVIICAALSNLKHPLVK